MWAWPNIPIIKAGNFWKSLEQKSVYFVSFFHYIVEVMLLRGLFIKQCASVYPEAIVVVDVCIMEDVLGEGLLSLSVLLVLCV